MPFVITELVLTEAVDRLSYSYSYRWLHFDCY